jgi:hypothetical protein
VKNRENRNKDGRVDKQYKYRDTCYNLIKMSQSQSTTVEVESGETLYYKELEKHISSLSERFRAKSVIKRCIYNDIVNCLSLPKGKTSGLFPPKFIHRTKQHFVLIKIAGINIACCIKSRKNICTYEEYYNCISEAHSNISHGGRDKNHI